MNVANFYFTHNPFLAKNLIRVLNDGYIRLGKDLPEKFRMLSGDQPNENIYGHIYFDDMTTIPYLWGYSIILHPKILYDIGVTYYEGWGGENAIKINKHSSMPTMKNKLMQIRKSLSKLYDEKKKHELPYPYRHEILFDKKISLRKYAIAVSCDMCSDEMYEKIKKLVANKKYNIVIIRRHAKDGDDINKIFHPPTLNEILSKIQKK